MFTRRHTQLGSLGGFPWVIVAPIAAALIGVGGTVWAASEARKRQREAIEAQEEFARRQAAEEQRKLEEEKKKQQLALLQDIALQMRIAREQKPKASVEIGGMAITPPMLLVAGLSVLTLMSDK